MTKYVYKVQWCSFYGAWITACERRFLWSARRLVGKHVTDTGWARKWRIVRCKRGHLAKGSIGIVMLQVERTDAA